MMSTREPFWFWKYTPWVQYGSTVVTPSGPASLEAIFCVSNVASIG
jgi:hypothetical protein